MQPQNADLLLLIQQTMQQDRKNFLLNLLSRLGIETVDESIFEALMLELKSYEEDFYKLQQALTHEELLQRTFYKPL